MGKARSTSVREPGQRRSARLEALEICRAAAAEEAAARAAQEAAQTPLEDPPTEPVARRRGRKKQKCRTVEDVVGNSVETSRLHQAAAAHREDLDAHEPHDPEAQPSAPFPFPPDRQVLEKVLQMLQKQDKDNIFAEPVNPLEVDHYYDVIKHPMDLSTMRIKQKQGLYETVEQFESDVSLMCQNAMTFNDTETIYYRKAHEMRDLASKIFTSLRTDPGGCNLEDIFKSKKRSKSISHCRQGSSRVGQPTVLALHAIPQGSASTRQNTASASAGRRRMAATSLGARSGVSKRSVVAEERENSYRPFESFLSTEEATASTLYDEGPIPFLPGIKSGGYIDSLRSFTRDLGPKVREIAERKIQEIESKEEQLRAVENYRTTQEQSQAAEERRRRARGKAAVVQATPEQAPQRASSIPAAPDRPDLSSPENLQLRTGVSHAQFLPGEFTAALIDDDQVIRVGENCFVLPSFVVEQSSSSAAATAATPASDSGSQFWPWQVSSTPATMLGLQQVESTAPAQAIVDPTEVWETGTWVSTAAQAQQSAGFGGGWPLVSASQVQEPLVLGPSQLQHGTSLMEGASNQVGSGYSINQLPWDLQGLNLAGVDQIQGQTQVGPTRLHQSDPGGSSVGSRSGSGSWIMPWNSGFGGGDRYDHPIMTQHQFLAGSTAMGPISSPSPGVAWTMKSLGGGGGDDHHRFEGGRHRVVQGSFQGDPSQGVQPFLGRHVGGSAGGVDPVGLLNQQVVQNRQQTGSSIAAGPDDLLTQFQNRQMGSLAAGQVDLLTHQLQNQQLGSDTSFMGGGGSSSAGPVDDPLSHQSTAGIFDLSHVQSCLRAAAGRRQPPQQVEAPTTQQPQPTEREFLEILENAQPDLALQL
ncbi:hypothetical protein H6P81_014677 [Aristolochia fimbriata]|uniref:Bromo domain-containing protein n=1 Tax=Aristolochia fimbriata TaxID=158543 RepID=A0AAV7E789_ARIFI|nr:hypothetical protein H6P81_014677 [Aristolochia fimbriata]